MQTKESPPQYESASIHPFPSLVWRDSYSVGVPHLDRQHRLLIGLINTLGDYIADGVPRDRVQRLLAEIETLAEYHVAAENEYLLEVHPRRWEHTRLHVDMLSQLSRRIARASRDWDEPWDVLAALVHWLHRHITQEDAQVRGAITAEPRSLARIAKFIAEGRFAAANEATPTRPGDMSAA